jgi:hypothetical protein
LAFVFETKIKDAGNQNEEPPRKKPRKEKKKKEKKDKSKDGSRWGKLQVIPPAFQIKCKSLTAILSG